MPENLFEAQYDISKKSKLKRFYDTNKVLIISSVLIIIILFSSYGFYLKKKEDKKILLSENYIQAKIYLENGNNNEALNILKSIIEADDKTYSTLSFFLILNKNLITDDKELLDIFNHLLENNKFDKEIKNLLIYKKALLNSNFTSETELLADLKPLLSKETLWKPHVLMLIGDYFVSKKEYVKAKEFYSQILVIKNLERDFYDQTILKLSLISNDS